jgi:hypothetical protein
LNEPKKLAVDAAIEKGKSLCMSALPKAFQRLLHKPVEDCLCIYKDDLKALKAPSNSARQG